MAPVVLVGVDGSEENLLALDWAVDEAVARGWELRMVHAVWLPMMEPMFVDRESILREGAEQVLLAAGRRVQERAPELTVTSALIDDSAGSALVRAGADAGLVVVGLRGRGGFPGLKLGSVAYQVAAHSEVPVVVVGTERPIPTDPPEIVVGIDDSPHGRAALRAAFAQARLRGARLRAVHAARHPGGPVTDAMVAAGYSQEFFRAEQERQARNLLGEIEADHPGVELVVSVQWDDATHALARASVTALMVVVGARGRRGFPRLALGSVAHGVLHHAGSPVMVVHVAPEREKEEHTAD